MTPRNDGELEEAHYYARICRPALFLSPRAFQKEEGRAQHESFAWLLGPSWWSFRLYTGWTFVQDGLELGRLIVSNANEDGELC